jgi:hypothetical protein
MRAIAILSTLLAVLCLSSSAARADGTWCARYSSPGGGSNCGFYSFAQCQATVSGIGGFCSQNSFAATAPDSRRRIRRDR